MSLSPLSINLDEMPFSRRGSWLSLGKVDAERTTYRGLRPGLFLRTMRGCISGGREIFRLDLTSPDLKSEPIMRATSSVLTMEGGGGRVEIVFSTPDRLLLRGVGVGLSLEAEPVCYATLRGAGEDRWEANLMAQRVQLMLTKRSGAVHIVAPWTGDICKQIRFEILPAEDGCWELEIEEFQTAWRAGADCGSFEDAVLSVERDFQAWLGNMPPGPAGMEGARLQAGYVQWSSLVSPRGVLRRETMLMSKNWMTNVWSWDHCFNAIALASTRPDLAWDQWAVMFDLQNEFGALPDCANDADVVWNFCKPPVHGWALGEMRRRGFVPDAGQLRQAYAWLGAWTDWWLTYRDEDGDGLPQYNHGNDSGWDNASCFAQGMPVEGPDLATFLILQIDVLSGLALELGEPGQAADWREKAGRLLQRMNEQLWTANGFIAPRSGDHVVSGGDSLVNFMPLMLGDRLAPEQRRVLISGLSRFLTLHGLATENPQSGFYRDDGYWRGPIWAPSTMLIVDGLYQCGESVFANDIARRFLATCIRGGMAENFNALTGAGLRDRAYSWTASGFFALGEDLILRAGRVTTPIEDAPAVRICVKPAGQP